MGFPSQFYMIFFCPSKLICDERVGMKERQQPQHTCRCAITPSIYLYIYWRRPHHDYQIFSVLLGEEKGEGREFWEMTNWGMFTIQLHALVHINSINECTCSRCSSLRQPSASESPPQRLLQPTLCLYTNKPDSSNVFPSSSPLPFSSWWLRYGYPNDISPVH